LFRRFAILKEGAREQEIRAKKFTKPSAYEFSTSFKTNYIMGSDFDLY
jgi:hypothetical protein